MSFPNFTFWSHLLVTLGIEVCCVAALGFLAQFLFRRAVWQRTIWQMTVVCLLLLPASEWTGFGRGMAWFLVGPKREQQNAPAPALVTVNPKIFRQLAMPPYRVSTTPKPAVWWPGWVWVLGSGAVLGRMAAAQLLLLALRLRREKIANDSLEERVVNVAKSIGLRRRICLLRMPESISPMAFGIFRFSIGLPPGFEARFSATEQEAVLAHELAHLASRDPLWFLVADFASALLWWHPLAWWVRRSLHVSSELAADEATALVPDGPGALAKCLVVLGKEMTAGHGWGWVGINGGFRSKLGKRVERLMHMPGGTSPTSASWASKAAKIALTIIIAAQMVLLFGTIQTVEGESENGWRESWNNSPGALLMLAAQDQTDKRKDDIATRIHDGKLLYEMGKFDEAEAIFVGVMNDDASQRAVPYYLDLIKEARFADRARAHKGTIIPIPLATNNIAYTSGRPEILSKLDRILLDEVSFDLPLTEVLTQLRAESKKRDRDGKGIDFFLAISQFDSPGNVPAGAIPAGSQAPAVDMGTVHVKISPPLQNLRLADVLNAITMVADQPIKYTVEDYGVLFSPKSFGYPTLYSKVFRVEPKAFEQALKNAYETNLNPIGSPTATNNVPPLDNMVRTYFTSVGVNLTEPGKSVFFNDRTGLLLIRATAEDLEITEKSVAALNQVPPQVTISAKFVELSQQDSAALGFDWFLQGSATNSTGIMSDPQFRLALNAVEHKTGVDILAAPKVTTLSGRQAHIGSSNGDNGVTLDVIAKVGQDGFSIQTTAIASIKDGNQTWQVAGSQKLWDGETLVMSRVMTNLPPNTRKVRMVFVSLRIIDPAGNAVHTYEEISNMRRKE